MMRLKHFIWYWLPVFLWAGMIFWFSHQPTLPGPKDYWLNFALKKPLHALEYGIFTWLLFRAKFSKFTKSHSKFTKSHFVNSDLRSASDLRSGTSLIFAVTVAILYAASDEIHQIFIPGREATARDFLFDAAGILLAAWRLKIKIGG